jgi:hypothetical protein
MCGDILFLHNTISLIFIIKNEGNLKLKVPFILLQKIANVKGIQQIPFHLGIVRNGLS